MSFWRELKEEWRKPFKGTREEKEEIYLNAIGIGGGIILWNIFGKPNDLAFFLDFMGAVGSILICQILVGIIYYKLIKR